MFVIAYANLDQFRSTSAQMTDLVELQDHSDVVAVVEWSRLSQQRIFPHVHPLKARAMRSSWRKYGNEIRNRWFRAILVRPQGLPAFWIVVVHMPPKRMWGPLYWAYARRLRKFLRSLPGPKLVVGDWNKHVSQDPARLHRTFGGKWFGIRIDGVWASPNLVKYVVSYVEVPQPHRADGHPFTYTGMSGD